LSAPSNGPYGLSASPSAPSTPTSRPSSSFSALLHERDRGLADATTADIQDYIIDIVERRRLSTADNRFRALRRFYVWLEVEEEIPNPNVRWS
jgi:site-specific recombinase XerD